MNANYTLTLPPRWREMRAALDSDLRTARENGDAQQVADLEAWLAFFVDAERIANQRKSP